VRGRYFEGVYYKHQSGGKSLALIPGRASDSAFVLVVTGNKAYNISYPLSHYDRKGDILRVGGNSFSPSGMSADHKGRKLPINTLGKIPTPRKNTESISAEPYADARSNPRVYIAKPFEPEQGRSMDKPEHEGSHTAENSELGKGLTADSMDDHYDGYYDDRVPEDYGQTKETLDPEMIKRIAIIAGGALFFVILSVVAADGSCKFNIQHMKRRFQKNCRAVKNFVLLLSKECGRVP